MSAISERLQRYPRLNHQSPEQARSHTRRLIVLAAFAVLSIVVLVAFLRYSSFHWNLFVSTLAALHPLWLAAGLLLAFVSYFGRAVRWKVMMLPSPSRLGSIFSATLIGFSAVVFLGRAGEVVRPLLIARRENSTFAAQAATWILERLFDLLLILLLFGTGLAESDSFDLSKGSVLNPVIRVGGMVVVVTAFAACAILYVFARRPESCRERLSKALAFLPKPLHIKTDHALGSFVRAAAAISQPRVMIWSSLLTIVEWALVLLSVLCFFRSHPAFRQFGLLEVAVYLGFVCVGNIVQLPGIGGGVQIVSVVVLTELFHRPLEVATGLSLLVWAGLTLIVLPFGISLAAAGHLKMADIRRDMRSISQEAPL